MRNTPETDKFVEYMNYQFPATEGHIRMREKVATLETQRDEAQAELLAERKRVGDAAALNMRLAHEKQGAEVALMDAKAEVERLRKRVEELEGEIRGLNHLWVPTPPAPIPAATSTEIFEAHGREWYAATISATPPVPKKTRVDVLFFSGIMVTDEPASAWQWGWFEGVSPEGTSLIKGWRPADAPEKLERK